MNISAKLTFKVRYYSDKAQTGVDEICESFNFSNGVLYFYTDDPIHSSKCLKSIQSYFIRMHPDSGLGYVFEGYQYIPSKGSYDFCKVEIYPVNNE